MDQDSPAVPICSKCLNNPYSFYQQNDGRQLNDWFNTRYNIFYDKIRYCLILTLNVAYCFSLYINIIHYEIYNKVMLT